MSLDATRITTNDLNSAGRRVAGEPVPDPAEMKNPAAELRKLRRRAKLL